MLLKVNTLESIETAHPFFYHVFQFDDLKQKYDKGLHLRGIENSLMFAVNMTGAPALLTTTLDLQPKIISFPRIGNKKQGYLCSWVFGRQPFVLGIPLDF
ncbi:hypothetical protein AB6A40_008364 [Gnathostoma spinigerum]|uniref:Uncharacterized protein n=1 Tax=Gnathostoma spinigerum TaxID=75299 RepID=A0ABD6EQ47_9BILA